MFSELNVLIFPVSHVSLLCPSCTQNYLHLKPCNINLSTISPGCCLVNSLPMPHTENNALDCLYFLCLEKTETFSLHFQLISSSPYIFTLHLHFAHSLYTSILSFSLVYIFAISSFDFTNLEYLDPIIALGLCKWKVQSSVPIYCSLPDLFIFSLLFPCYFMSSVLH